MINLFLKEFIKIDPRKIVFLCCFSICSSLILAQETSIRISPLKVIIGGIGITIEQQIGSKSSFLWESHFYAGNRQTFFLGNCGGITTKVAYRYYWKHKVGGLRGLYLSPGFKHSSLDCFRYGRPLQSIGILGIDLGFQAIEKGGFSFDIYLGVGANLTPAYGENSYPEGGISFGYTFGEILGESNK